MPAASPDLAALLKRTFGYSTFRPLQRDIIDATLAGKDVFALLPTGGGKSLCFQLPALARPGLTVVVSPLIALMKDQVDQLKPVVSPPRFSTPRSAKRKPARGSPASTAVTTSSSTPPPSASCSTAGSRT